jgi:3-oxoacyl-[acyl-carrier protein] reductase
VTGASRGIGALVSKLLAERGLDIVVNYHSKRPRAEIVASAVRGRGRRALVAQADLTCHDAVAAMVETVRVEFGRIDLLILNASGGRIVFVTSHLAHFYADRGVKGSYEAVAASKYAGEQALSVRRPEFNALGVSLVIVSGDMIEGTITPKLLERMKPGVPPARRDQAGQLPTVEQFAKAIVDAAFDSKRGDAVIFVGHVD